MAIMVKKHGVSALILFVFVLTSAPDVRPDDTATPPKQYRVIFNCDGHAVCKDAGGDLELWLDNLFGPLEGTHVEALFWCDGAGGNTANYESDVLEPTGQRIGQPRPWIRKLLREGHDPPKVVVREAKKRGLDVFYSFRINDIHDAFMPDELATFKEDNPQWLIGEQQYGDVTSFPTSLNFAVPEIRELKFRVIEEIFRKYDFDGLEVDFMRSAPYFLPGEEASHAHLLTELLERIRTHLNQRAQERGHPIRLAVRVDESRSACRLNGFDISTWIERGLIDYLITGSGVIDIEVQEFKQLAGGRVLVYPCLYGWPSKYNPIPVELAAGLSLNYRQQGADGIYLFNWFPHSHNNSESASASLPGLLKHIGDPQAILASQQKLMFAADRGRPERAYQYNWMDCVLPAVLPDDDTLTVPLSVGTDLNDLPPNLPPVLQIAVENLQTNDVVHVSLNGQPVETLPTDESGTVSATLSAKQLAVGRNQAVLTLASRSPTSDAPRTVTALEIHVRNPAPTRQHARLVEQRQLNEGNAGQGLAAIPDGFCTATSREILRYDAEWNLLDRKQIRIPGVNHLGAIDYHDGFIWAGLLHGPEGGEFDKSLNRAVIARIRAQDLEVEQTWDITRDVNWIDPVCFDGAHLWVGDLSDLGIHRYSVEGNQLVRNAVFRYPKAMHFSQGIRVRGNRLYTIHTFGDMDGLFEFEIPNELTDAVNHPLRVWDIQETRMHLEGFDFVPGRDNEIWHAQGTQVDRYVLKGISEDLTTSDWQD